jgi:hypothetical protein
MDSNSLANALTAVTQADYKLVQATPLKFGDARTVPGSTIQAVRAGRNNGSSFGAQDCLETKSLCQPPERRFGSCHRMHRPPMAWAV